MSQPVREPLERLQIQEYTIQLTYPGALGFRTIELVQEEIENAGTEITRSAPKVTYKRYV